MVSMRVTTDNPNSGDLLFQDCSPLPKFSAWIRRWRRNFAVMPLLKRGTRVFTVITPCELLHTQMPPHDTLSDIPAPSYIVIGRKPEE
jgi:hypothetical protein